LTANALLPDWRFFTDYLDVANERSNPGLERHPKTGVMHIVEIREKILKIGRSSEKVG